MLMRVGRLSAIDDERRSLLELLANFWQDGFLMTIPLGGESENSRLFIELTRGRRDSNPRLPA